MAGAVSSTIKGAGVESTGAFGGSMGGVVASRSGIGGNSVGVLEITSARGSVVGAAGGVGALKSLGGGGGGGAIGAAVAAGSEVMRGVALSSDLPKRFPNTMRDYYR